MSNSAGAVISREEGTIQSWFMYVGTSDVCFSHLFDTKEEMQTVWRSAEWLSCDCEGEDILLWSAYGSCFYWPGRACFEHNTITANGMPWNPDIKFEEGIKEGVPFPIPELEAYLIRR